MELFFNEIIKKLRKITNIINLQNIASIVAICASLYYVFNLIYTTFYKMECENFYKIPNRYFSSDIFLKMIASLILTGIYIIPLMYCHNKSLYLLTETSQIVILFIFLDLSSYIVNVSYLSEIIIIYNFQYLVKLLNNNWFYLIILLINSLPYFLMYLYLKSKCKYIIDINIDVTDDDMNNLKKKRTFLNRCYVISLVIYFLIFIFEIIFPFISPIENKRKYEFVTTNDVDYVVLSHVDDKILICEYDEDNGKYEFFTSNYKLIDESGDMNYSYTVIDDKPTITTDKVKAKIVESSIKSSIDD